MDSPPNRGDHCAPHALRDRGTRNGVALLEIGPGDEVIMPSFTFVSTANAFVLRGAAPVFVDIRADTLNLDETLVEAAITPRTKAIASGALRRRRLRDGRDSRASRSDTACW